MLKIFNRKKKNNKGFGLIEVLVSVAIMGIVTLPLTQSFVTSTEVNRKSEVKLSAITVAENKMEQAKALDLSDYEKAEDGKYYINDDAVDENGNTFNVQTIIDPTKYDDSKYDVYDWSTFSSTKNCNIILPDPFPLNSGNGNGNNGNGNGNNGTVQYDLIITITENKYDDSKIQQDITYELQASGNEYGPISVFSHESKEYDENGNKLGISSISIDYYGEKKVKLKAIKIYNRNNVDVVVNLNKIRKHDNSHDSINIYEGYYTKTDEPYTLIGDYYERSRFTYRRYKENNSTEDETVEYDNFMYNSEGNSNGFTIGILEVMHAVDVNVYEYIDSDDESVKYDNDLLLTTLQGSKIVEY